MRILLDECVNERLRNHLPDHDVQSARYAGFSGLKNEELLEASLEKNSNLASAAGRYNVDAAKIGAGVRVELSKSKKKPTKESQPASYLSTAKSPHHKRSK